MRPEAAIILARGLTKLGLYEDAVEFVNQELDPDRRGAILEELKDIAHRVRTLVITPTPSQVEEYAKSKGYTVDGKVIVEYYADNNWRDSMGKPVKNWKGKVLSVWCKPGNKIGSHLKPKTF